MQWFQEQLRGLSIAHASLVCMAKQQKGAPARNIADSYRTLQHAADLDLIGFAVPFPGSQCVVDDECL